MKFLAVAALLMSVSAIKLHQKSTTEGDDDDLSVSKLASAEGAQLSQAEMEEIQA